MSKEHIALGGLLLALATVLWNGGGRLAAMQVTIETLSQETSLLRADLSAINTHFIQWAAQHQAH